VAATVKVRDKALQELSGAEVSLLVSSGGKTNLAAKAVFDSASRSYVAQISLPSSGQFRVTATATAKGRTLGDDRQLLVCEAADRENSEPRANPELMGNIARLSGGKTLSLAESDSSALSSVFANAPPVTVEYRRTPLWAQSWCLVAVLGLLATEWAVRRLNGMA
jgi:hypothetical protein